MLNQADLLDDLQTLNKISRMLNQSADIGEALEAALAQLLALVGLDTGWVFARDRSASERWSGRGFRLAAHHNLPPSLSVTNPEAWDKTCDCQTMCLEGTMAGPYEIMPCNRLDRFNGELSRLGVHATVPLYSGDRLIGILSVAAADWSDFTPWQLSLLTHVGNMMGMAMGRSRLFIALQDKRFHEQAALLDLSQQLLSRRDLNDLLAYIVEEVRIQLKADACAVLLTGPDPDYLYFRAASGWFGDPVGNDYRAPADKTTGSGRAMYTQRAVLIEDLGLQDPPLWTSDWLESEGFKAVAVVPLIADGESIGVLLIDSRTPRHFTEAEVRFLRLMANQVALALEKARLHEEELRRERLEEELDVARQIQVSMLPASPPELPGWEFAAYFEAAHLVSGDFYDVFPLPGEPDRLGVVIADVSDKGVPAAIFMALSRTTIRNIALRGRAPAEVLSWANRYIQEDSESDMFLSAFYAELNTRTGWLTYANAGHNPPLLWRAAERKFHRLAATCPILGVLAEIEVAVVSLQLEPGDLLVLYTDGVTEALTADYQEFGVGRLEDTISRVLTETPGVTADDVRAAIRRALQGFAGDMVQVDDVTLLIIQRSEATNDEQ